ncbi:MAG: chemotaxis protein CheW [Sulfuricurvum sp.]|jgi:chemotaxis signal transduction protein|uniref:chemotaxis protein CheW n=1 Tax=Sulfuricurvum sp. TaxID=2025608 RepID=UPI002601108E|nr:chemotaxis protein CheW [Sulfuricurvum sp.]MCK9371842.1 chemotaxis protein CheW [Sulfuricurvum sp.]
MKDYIVFTVAGNHYAIEVASIERIVQTPPITAIPNAHPYIDGMMSYERRVTKVVNFRKMTDLPTHEAELIAVFTQVKQEHEVWEKALRDAIMNGTEFHLTTDPHGCRLGKWLDHFSTHDSDILAILKQLRSVHSRLHELGKELLLLCQKDSEAAKEMLKQEMGTVFENTIRSLDKMISACGTISGHSQKMLIYRNGENLFAIKVDTIEDMTSIDASMMKEVDSANRFEEFLETSGVVEMDEKLVNVIKSVSLPVRKGL